MAFSCYINNMRNMCVKSIVVVHREYHREIQPLNYTSEKEPYTMSQNYKRKPIPFRVWQSAVTRFESLEQR